MFIVDALPGNFDRHGANRGFLKKDNKYTHAPIFYNGSSLFPSMTGEDEMKEIMGSQEETDKRILTFPTSQIKLQGKKSSYYDVINSLEFEECNKALVNVYKRINILQKNKEVSINNSVRRKNLHSVIWYKVEKLYKNSKFYRYRSKSIEKL